MTKREAIKQCKLLWKEIEESGLSKNDFFDTPEGKKWAEKGYDCNCPLCEYAFDFMDDCLKCPLVIQCGKKCYGLGFKEGVVSSPSFFKSIRGLK